MRVNLKIFLFAVFPWLVFSCRKPKCDENVPAIAYKNFLQYHDAKGKTLDSAKIIITFKDCDGDIGLDEKDTTGSFAPQSKYYHNFILKYSEMVNGNWVSCDTCFRYRIPKLTPEGQSKILEGEIGLTISPFYFDFTSANSDSIKFGVLLYDRELHESNLAETPVILTK